MNKILGILNYYSYLCNHGRKISGSEGNLPSKNPIVSKYRNHYYKENQLSFEKRSIW
ncbi:hypothetical protein CRYO30217_01574 [Parvicella tangerina]|uniref:Uncharacterized protein n=1 Tax=Parvicella tangerina TaxID=2829795 RepID=A0A916JLN1_9FLAO|nr:hypothetical protein CRYO30217_01574 [Parvicella tangerina]